MIPPAITYDMYPRRNTIVILDIRNDCYNISFKPILGMNNAACVTHRRAIYIYILLNVDVYAENLVFAFSTNGY